MTNLMSVYTQDLKDIHENSDININTETIQKEIEVHNSMCKNIEEEFKANLKGIEVKPKYQKKEILTNKTLLKSILYGDNLRKEKDQMVIEELKETPEVKKKKVKKEKKRKRNTESIDLTQDPIIKQNMNQTLGQTQMNQYFQPLFQQQFRTNSFQNMPPVSLAQRYTKK